MRGAVVLILVGVLLVGACGGGEDGPLEASAKSDDLVIKTSVVGATTPGAEPIATGEAAERSTLGGSPFCATWSPSVFSPATSPARTGS